MSAALNFLNGKKTLIGVVLFYIAGVLACWYDSTGWVMPDVVKGLQAAAEYTGYFIGGAGVVHKLGKGEIPLPGKNSNLHPIDG